MPKAIFIDIIVFCLMTDWGLLHQPYEIHKFVDVEEQDIG